MNYSQRQQQVASRGTVTLPVPKPYVPPLIRRTIPEAETQTPRVPARAQPQAQQRAVNPSTGAFTVDTTPQQIYGCTGLFDLCSDADVISLSMQGSDKFLDWLGWQRTDVCDIKKSFVDWIRPAYADSAATVGYLADPCAASNGVEWGKCDFQLTDFGRLRRHTPVRDITKVGLRLCDLQPRYRLDGTVITDDLEFDMRIVTEVLLQDLRRYIITGSKLTSGLFDGLERLVNTGYTDIDGHTCSMMDSIVVDWNANTLDGGSGITWNGAAVASTFDFIDVLLAVYRRIRQRISWSPSLSSPLGIGDMVIVGTTNFLQCLLDAFTCWRVCPGQQYNETNLNSLEAREFRQGLNGGQFGNGHIYLDGFEIPLLAYDWGLQKGPTRSDVYLLTRQVGGVRLINGQYNDLTIASAKRPGWYDATDGGRLLTWVDSDGTCDQRQVEMQPRLLMWAPWAQARFTDVKCTQPGGVISPDPTETSFFPETSFFVAGAALPS